MSTSHTVVGTAIDHRTRRGVPNLRVEAWETGAQQDDLLGIDTTAPDGRFRLDFETSDVKEDAASDLPKVALKVLQRDRVIPMTEPVPDLHGLLPGTTLATIELDLQGADDQEDNETSAEIGMHELGESLAASVSSFQDELDRYSGPRGRHVLDEVTLSIPIEARVDALGQLLVRSRDPERPGGEISLRLRLDDGIPMPHPAPVDVTSMSTLTSDEVAVLRKHRIFSVEDLMRVYRNPSGRSALRKIGVGDNLEALSSEAELLTLPVVPRRVLEVMPTLGIRAYTDLLTADPEKLAVGLTDRLRQAITSEDVSFWQRELGDLGKVPLPKHDAPRVDPLAPTGADPSQKPDS